MQELSGLLKDVGERRLDDEMAQTLAPVTSLTKGRKLARRAKRAAQAEEARKRKGEEEKQKTQEEEEAFRQQQQAQIAQLGLGASSKSLGHVRDPEQLAQLMAKVKQEQEEHARAAMDAGSDKEDSGSDSDDDDEGEDEDDDDDDDDDGDDDHNDDEEMAEELKALDAAEAKRKQEQQQQQQQAASQDPANMSYSSALAKAWSHDDNDSSSSSSTAPASTAAAAADGSKGEGAGAKGGKKTAMQGGPSAASIPGLTRQVVFVNRKPEIEATRTQLPVVGQEQEVMEAINENSVVVVCGPTGSGKTTQIPQFLYEAGYNQGCALHFESCVSASSQLDVGADSRFARLCLCVCACVCVVIEGKERKKGGQ
mgnify:CR=1 FL=1